MAELEKLLCTDSKVESLKKINAIIDNTGICLENKITNCITEIPQRIKYTLENGTLTIKAGSVVIVPYGVEDLTSQYPKGATFLHENFKVYDTQFEDGKFFVWAEVQSDILHSTTVGTANGTLIFAVGLENSIQYREPVSMFSGSNDTMARGTTYYQIENNEVISHNLSGSDIQVSLPILIGGVTNNTIVSILQIFNGMGYIGSTVWVDKGVKGLIPNGRNEDGTLRNIEYTADKIYMRTFADTVNLTQETLVFTPFNPEFSYFRGTPSGFEITQDGFIYSPYRDEILKGFVALSASSTNGKITNFTPKLPFRAVDYSDKAEIISWGMPDYSAGVSLTYTTTNTNFPFSGVAYFGYRGASNTSAKIYINDQEFGLNGSSANNISGQTAYIVSQNDVYRYQTSSNGQYGIIYPMKGTK